MKSTCAICWGSLADDPRPLGRICEDGSVLRCHRSHALTARINGFKELEGGDRCPRCEAELPYHWDGCPLLRPAPRRVSWPAKILS